MLTLNPGPFCLCSSVTLVVLSITSFKKQFSGLFISRWVDSIMEAMSQAWAYGMARHTVSTVLKKTQVPPASHLLFFTHFRTSAHRAPPSLLKMGLPSSVRPFWKHCYRHAQKCVALAILKPTTSDSSQAPRLQVCTVAPSRKDRQILKGDTTFRNLLKDFTCNILRSVPGKSGHC